METEPRTTVFVLLAVIFLLSLMIEAIVEYLLGTPMSKSPRLAQYSWALMYVSAAVATYAAFHYRLDLINLLALELGYTIQPSGLGFILTGLTIGRGSNAVHDLLMKIFVRKDIPGQVQVVNVEQAPGMTNNLRYPIEKS